MTVHHTSHFIGKKLNKSQLIHKIYFVLMGLSTLENGLTLLKRNKMKQKLKITDLQICMGSNSLCSRKLIPPWHD